MKYTKKEATILRAGIRKSIKKKWEPLTSGKFKGIKEPDCALCDAQDRVERNGGGQGRGDCPGCPFVDSRARVCWNGGHVFANWSDEIEAAKVEGISFRKAANTSAVVKSAGRVLASLRQAEARMDKVLAGLEANS